MISLPGTLWGCTGSPDMPGHMEMKWLTSLQGVTPLRNLLDLSRPLGSLGGISIIRFNAGWITSIWQCGIFLIVLRDRLEN